MADRRILQAPNGANTTPADDVAFPATGSQYVTVGTLRTTIRGAALTSIASLTTSAGQGLYTTGANTYATATVTVVGRSFWAAADPGANRGWYWNDSVGEIRALTFGSGLTLDTGTNTLTASGGGGGGSGDVVGPASATNSAVAQFDGVTGKLIKSGPSIGTSANNLVQLDGTARLPAVDGSQLTGLPAGATDLSYTAATRVIASSTGADATLPLVTTGDAGLAPASGGGSTNFLRADGTWAAPAGGTGTDLSYTAATRIIASSTGADATLPLVTSGDAGLAPASGGGSTNFLRADGTWAAPAGGGDVTQAGANVFTGTNAFEDIRYVTQTIATPTAIDLGAGQYLKHSSSGTVTYNITAGGASAGQVKIVTFELTASGGALTPTFQYGGEAVVWPDGSPTAIASGEVENFVIHLDGIATAGAARGFRRTGSGTGDVTAASPFGTDNVIVRSDGTGKGVQATGITIADTTNNVSGVGTITSGAITSTGQVQGTTFKATAISNQIALGTTNIGTINWSLTGTRTLTLPDATCTVVCQTTPDTLTNKILDDNTNTVRANKIRETGGPTVLTVGAIGDGQMAVRSGTTLVGQNVPSGGGDVVGPASATDNAFARFDTTTGKLIQNSVVIADDSGNVSGAPTITATTSMTAPIFEAPIGAGNASAVLRAHGDGGSRLIVRRSGVDLVAFDALANASAVNFLRAVATATGSGVIMQASSVVDADINTFWIPKGAGDHFLQRNSRNFRAGGVWTATADPTVSDDGIAGYRIGTLWLNTTTNAVFICESSATGAAVWNLIGGVTGTDLSYTAATRLLASSTGADVTLPLVTTGDAGLAPASGGGSTNFLRADGTWAAPAGGTGTDLSYTPTTRLLESSTGADVTLPLQPVVPGWPASDNSQTTLSVNPNTRVVTVGSVGASFQVWSGTGPTLHTKTGNQAASAYTNTTGMKYVTFDANGDIAVSDTAFDFWGPSAITASIYHQTTGPLAKIFNERHTADRQRHDHASQHNTIGSYWANGLQGTFGDTTGSISFTSGEFRDEDIRHIYAATTTTCDRVYRISGGTWTWDADQTDARKTTSSNLGWDNAGTITAASVNNFVNYWFFAVGEHSTDATPVYKIHCLVGQVQHGTEGAALAETLASLSLPPWITAEAKLLYRVTYQRTEPTPAGDISANGIVDFRRTTQVGGTQVTGVFNGIVVEDEGAVVSGGPFPTINFTGTAVSVTGAAGEATVTIPGPTDELFSSGTPTLTSTRGAVTLSGTVSAATLPAIGASNAILVITNTTASSITVTRNGSNTITFIAGTTGQTSINVAAASTLSLTAIGGGSVWQER